MQGGKGVMKILERIDNCGKKISEKTEVEGIVLIKGDFFP